MTDIVSHDRWKRLAGAVRSDDKLSRADLKVLIEGIENLPEDAQRLLGILPGQYSLFTREDAKELVSRQHGNKIEKKRFQRAWRVAEEQENGASRCDAIELVAKEFKKSDWAIKHAVDEFGARKMRNSVRTFRRTSAAWAICGPIFWGGRQQLLEAGWTEGQLNITWDMQPLLNEQSLRETLKDMLKADPREF